MLLTSEKLAKSGTVASLIERQHLHHWKTLSSIYLTH